MTGRSCVNLMGTFEPTPVARTHSAALIAGLEPQLPTAYAEPRWYAAYTSSNHEKRVAEQLAQRSVEHLLPLYQTVRRWKDRRVCLQLPLFPGYVFVRLALRDRLHVLQITGVSKLVGFNGTPTALREEEIEALRTSLASGVRVEPHPYLTVGRLVRIKAGPFRDVEGVILRRKGCFRVVVSIHLLRQSIALDVDLVDVESIAMQ